MKKLIAILLTFTMVMTMFASFGIVTTQAAGEVTYEVAVWTQDFEKNHEGDDEALWASGAANNKPYSGGGRFNTASVGAGHLVDEADNNYLLWYPSTSSAGTGLQAAVKVFLDQTHFEVGKSYQITAEIGLDINEIDDDDETANRGFDAFVLNGTGYDTTNQGTRIILKEGQTGVVSTATFEYTQELANTDGGLNLRINPLRFSVVETDTGIDKDRYTIDNVKIIEIGTDTEAFPTGEGSVFDDYVLGTTMDFENLTYNSFRGTADADGGRDVDGNGNKRIVPDLTGAENKVFRSPYVSGVTGGQTAARTELIGILANAGNVSGKTYTLSFKMYPQGLSDVPITFGFKYNPGVTAYSGQNQLNLTEGVDFKANQWNNISIDLSPDRAEAINLSMHQRSIGNGATMDFTNHTYYKYIFIDDLVISEKVQPESYFTDVFNSESWTTTSEDIFSVETDKITVGTSNVEESLNYTVKGVKGRSMVFDYTAALTSDAEGILPYIAVCTEEGNVLGISKIDSNAVTGKLYINVPFDPDNSSQFDDIIFKVVAGNVPAEITDISVSAIGSHYALSTTTTQDGSLAAVADFKDLPVPASAFTAVAMAEGEEIINFTKDMLDSYPYGTANGAAKMNIPIEMGNVEEYKSTYNIILYNEENSIYLNVGEAEYVNPNFTYTVLSLLQNAESKDEVKEIINAEDTENEIVNKEVLGLNTIGFFADATENDLEVIYQYIYDNRADVIDEENNNSLTPLHNLIYKAYAVSIVKNSYGVAAFNDYVSNNSSVLGMSAYSTYYDRIDLFTNYFLDNNVFNPTAKKIAKGTIKTFEEMMDAICAILETSESDKDVIVYKHDMENGDFAKLTEGVDYEKGGQGNSGSTTSMGVVRAGDEGITDPYGNEDGNVLKFELSGSARYKLMDVFNPTGLTPRDMGTQYEISMKVLLPTTDNSTLDVGVFSVRNYTAAGDVSTSSPNSKYQSSPETKFNTSTLVRGQWCDFTATYTANSMLPSELCIEGASAYIDDIVIKIVNDNRREIDPRDLQPLDNESAVTLNGVEKTDEGYVFENGGTLKYGVGDAQKQGQRYVAENGKYYRITLVAKTNSDNAFTLTGNSVRVIKSSSEIGDTYSTMTDYPTEDVDDFDLEVGGENDVTISSGDIVASNGATMINTNGEYKTITILFKDTGYASPVVYAGREMEILRSINITSNGEGNVIKSMTISEIDDTTSIIGGDFSSDEPLSAWGGANVDENVFSVENGNLTITNSPENAGAEISQSVMLNANNFVQVGFTNIDNATGDAALEVYDDNGNLLGKTKLSPVESEYSDKMIVIKTPAADSADDNYVNVTLKVVAGTEGENTITDIRVLSSGDEAYVDLDKYFAFTNYFETQTNAKKEALINKVFDEATCLTGEDYLNALSDEIINSQINASSNNPATVADILANNAEYLGLTNWPQVESYKEKSFYNDIKKYIGNYVLENGYDGLNDVLAEVLSDAIDEAVDAFLAANSENPAAVADFLADNTDYFGLTNWSAVKAYETELYYDAVKEYVGNYVLENGYEGLNDVLADLLANNIDEIITNSLVNAANTNHNQLIAMLAEYQEEFGLTNWNLVEACKTKSYYGELKEEIAGYVIKNGYENLNDNISDLIDDAKDSGNSGGGGGGGGSSSSSRLPSTITSSNKPVTTPDDTQTPDGAPDVNFTDLDSVEWARESILALARKGIISGYEDGTFRPNNDITRAEFAKLLVLAFDVYDENATCSEFNDVSPFDWYYSYVATLANLGVTKGMGDGSYGAYEKITRQDMVVLIVRMAELLGKPINATTTEVTMTDSDEIADYAAEAVKTLQMAQIVSGYEDGSFRPYASATRAQVAKILYALIG